MANQTRNRFPYKDDDAIPAPGERRVCWKCGEGDARRLTSAEFGGMPGATKDAMDKGYIDLWFCDSCATYQNRPVALS